MHPAAASINYFGVYVIVTGLGLTFVPALVLAPLGIPAPAEVWIRVVGALAIILGYDYRACGQANAVAFFRATIGGRIAFARQGPAPGPLGARCPRCALPAAQDRSSGDGGLPRAASGNKTRPVRSGSRSKVSAQTAATSPSSASVGRRSRPSCRFDGARPGQSATMRPSTWARMASASKPPARPTTSSLSTDTAKWFDQKCTSRSTNGVADCRALPVRAATAAA